MLTRCCRSLGASRRFCASSSSSSSSPSPSVCLNVSASAIIFFRAQSGAGPGNDPMGIFKSEEERSRLAEEKADAQSKSRVILPRMPGVPTGPATGEHAKKRALAKPISKKSAATGAAAAGAANKKKTTLPGASILSAAKAVPAGLPSALGGGGGGGGGGGKKTLASSSGKASGSVKLSPKEWTAAERKQAMNLLDLRNAPSNEDGPNGTLKLTGRPQEMGYGMLPSIKMMPLNPQFKDKEVKDMAKAPPGVGGPDVVFNNTSRRKNRYGNGLQFTAAQSMAIIDRYADTRWFGPIWRALKIVNPDTVRRNKWICIGGAWVCLFVIFMVTSFVYKWEMDLFTQLEPQDQRDLKKVMWGARVGEIKPIGEAALDKVDPLRILPDKEKIKIIIQAYRDAGLVDKDWELEARKRKSLFVEPDFEHIGYWTIMTIGRYTIGSAYMFMDGYDEVGDTRDVVAENLRKHESQQEGLI